jgi:hypothetical protein
MPRKPILFVLTNNHFDPTWRRCWDRRFTYRGKSFASYAEIESYYMLDNLALARRDPEYKFEAESTVVVRKFLESHPERRGELRRLADAGRFDVSGAGENIIDVNMVLGESMVRNFLLGLLWIEEHLGLKTDHGVRNDGFGNSAQLPQVFRGCEIPWATGFSYSPLNGNYWRGLDGSVVCAARPPLLVWAGGCDKYPPCGKCRGKGCRACAGRGIEPALRCRLPEQFDEKRLREAGVAFIALGPEENLPNPQVPAWVRKWRAKYDVRFAIERELRPFVAAELTAVDRPPKREVHPGVELNPNNSGCLVTRIKLKQTLRRQEYALLGAETLASLAALNGAAYPREGLDAAWRMLLFTMFHDAVTATHVDPAYTELCDMAREIDGQVAEIRGKALARLVKPAPGVLSVLNPGGLEATAVVKAEVPASGAGVELRDEAGDRVPVLTCEAAAGGRVRVSFVARNVPALSSRQYRVGPGRAPAAPRLLRRPVIENEFHRIVADEHGLVSVYDKRLRREIARPGEYRPNELIVERDEGSPWATLHADRPRRGLAAQTRLIYAVAGEGWQRLEFEVRASDRFWGCGDPLAARTSVTLCAGLDRVEVATEVFWDNYNLRLRVAWPVPFRGRAVYGIPYGMLARGSYKPSFHWAGANGDWPAVNWAGVEGRECSVALLNRGIPSYAVEKDVRGGRVMLLSVLRSPAIPTYLHEPNFYSMTAFDGMRDAGTHRLEYALSSYAEPFAKTAVVAHAEEYNAGLLAAPGEARLPRVPLVISENVRLTTLKRSEQGKAWIVRLAEHRGRAGHAVVRPPEGVRGVQRVNMLERQGRSVRFENGVVEVDLRAWEIATLRFEV